MKNIYYYTSLFLALTLACVSLQRCIVTNKVTDHARDNLIKGNAEDPRYGLYSYVLFSQKPDRHLEKKYRSVIKAYYKKISTTDDVRRFRPRKKINIIYLPLREELPHDFENFDLEKKTNWVLKKYDYARAEFLLNKIERNLDKPFDKGPYIISYNTALSKAPALTKRILIQDFTFVHHAVASLWMDEFLQQSLETEYWSEEHLNNFANDLRNSIAITAEGLEEVSESLSWWKDSLKGWVTLK